MRGKQRLAGAYRLFSRCGFDEGVAGHITCRDPELTDHFWVNPFAVDFSLITASDLILVNHHGEVVEGRWAVNAAAFAHHPEQGALDDAGLDARMAELWWDPEAIHPNGDTGAYRYVRGGKRYTFGGWPTEDPLVFQEGVTTRT